MYIQFIHKDKTIINNNLLSTTYLKQMKHQRKYRLEEK